MGAPRPPASLVNVDFVEKLGLLVILFIVQAVVFSMVLTFARQGSILTFLSSVCLAFVPAFVTMTYLGRLHRTSTIKRQSFISFMEALLFVAGLLLLCIDPIDFAFGELLELSRSFTCTDVAGDFNPFVHDLFWVVHCDDNFAAGKKCEESANGLMSYRELHKYYKVVDGKVALPERAMRSLAEPIDCEELKEETRKAIGPITVDPFKIGNRTFDLTNSSVRIAEVTSHPNSTEASEVSFNLYEESMGFYIIKSPVLAFLEESLKFFLVRRIIFKDRVADPVAAVVYSVAVGAGFAAGENLQRAISHIPALHEKPSAGRLSLAMPLHCATALMIGMGLGYRKFLGRAYSVPSVLAFPVLLHSLFNFATIFPNELLLDWIIGVGSLLVGFLYCRVVYLGLNDVNDVNIRELVAEGIVSSPLNCFVESGLSVWMRSNDDPIAAEARMVEEQSASSAARQMGKPPPSSFCVSIQAMTRILFANLLPPTPMCETQDPALCTQCDKPCRSHLVYPSTCPYCTQTGASPPVSNELTSLGAQATGIGF